MNVASLENCKKLYELSGWIPSELKDGHRYEKGHKQPTPAYDSGFLLRKLPKFVDFGDGILYQFRLEIEKTSERWWASYSHTKDIQTYADTPENALCLLAIKLFEEAVL